MGENREESIRYRETFNGNDDAMSKLMLQMISSSFWIWYLKNDFV